MSNSFLKDPEKCDHPPLMRRAAGGLSTDKSSSSAPRKTIKTVWVVCTRCGKKERV